MSFKKSVLIFLVLLIVPLVAANTNHWTWGNIAFQGAGVGVDDILFGSNYPQGSTNMSNTTLALSSDYPPIVADWNLDGENEIFIFAGSSIALYDNDLQLRSTVNIGAPMQGKACIFNMGSDTDLELAIVVDSNLKVYEPSGINFNLVRNIALGAVYYDAYCTVGFDNDEFVIAARGGDFAVVDPQGETVDNFNNDLTNADICSEGGGSTAYYSNAVNGFQNRGFYFDYDNDGDNDYVFVQTATGLAIVLNAYDVGNASYNIVNQTVIAGGSGECRRMNIGFGNIGSISSANELIFTTARSSVGANPFSQYLLEVTDIFASSKYSDTVTAATKLGTYMSFPAIADIDTDSANELCYIKNVNFTCYNSVFVQEYNFAFPQSNVTGGEYNYIALGEYAATSPTEFLEVLHPTGLFSVDNGNKELDVLMNFSSTNSDNSTLPYVASVEQQASFTKDIILADRDTVVVFTRQTAAAVCGNGVCESGESILNCQADCSEDLINRTVQITSIVFDPSIANVWKNNTDVRIVVTVEDTTGATVQARSQLYYGQGVEQDSDWTTLSPSGTAFVFNMKANSTTSSSVLRVTARNSVNNNTEDIQLFGFTVALDGDSKGDSTSTYSNPFPTAPDPTETDTDDNAIRNAIEEIPTGNLGFDMVWYIIMFAVGAGIMIFGMTELKNSSATFGLFLIAETGLLIMGTLLGFIPVGIVIVIVVIGLIIIGMWLRKIFTGTGT